MTVSLSVISSYIYLFSSPCLIGHISAHTKPLNSNMKSSEKSHVMQIFWGRKEGGKCYSWATHFRKTV